MGSWCIGAGRAVIGPVQTVYAQYLPLSRLKFAFQGRINKEVAILLGSQQ